MKDSFYRRHFPKILLLGIIIGSICGVVFGQRATIVKPLGDIFLNLMFTIVVPMVFISITSAVGSMVDMQRLGKILGSTVMVFIVTGLIAAVFVITTVTVFPPAAGSAIDVSELGEMVEAKSGAEILVESLTVSNFSELLTKERMLPLIVFSIMFGFAVAKNGGDESFVGKFLINLNDVVMSIVDYIMLYAPIGLGAYFANLIGDLGPALISDYARVLAIYYPLVLIYTVVMFPIYSYYAGGIEGVKRMIKYVPAPMITAFATQSSVATLPVNKEACDGMGVPRDISNIVLPMGATMHMDGSVISSIVKIAFLFGIFGIPYAGVGTIAKSILIAILSAFVLSGAPGGGLVGEMLIVTLFNFPMEAFPIVATIGFLVDPAATMLNASGDALVSMIVAKRVEGKNWINRL